MKLLFFVPEPLPTFRADVSTLFGKYLPRLGLIPTVVGMRGTGNSSDTRFTAVHMPSGRGGRVRRELSYVLCCLRALWLDASSADLIQVRDMVPIGILCWVWATLKRKPFIYWMSYLMSEGRIVRAEQDLQTANSLFKKVRALLVLAKGQLEAALLYGFLLPRAKHVFVQSDAMKLHVMGRGISPEKMTTVPMGVDCENLFPGAFEPRRLPGWEISPIVAYLGTMDRIRRIDLLVDAFAMFRAQCTDARLLLVGDSAVASDRELLQAHIASRGLADCVHVTGWLPIAQALPLLTGADVAVSFVPRGTILDTGSPTKILEYLALALPCVGNDNPDQAQALLESRAGTLVASDVPALAQGLSKVMRDLPAARSAAAQGPPYIAKRRSYQYLAETVQRVYQLLDAQ